MKNVKEECAVFGIYGKEDAAQITYLGLYSLQHRGQESSGIISSDGERVYEHKDMGLVSKVFPERVIERLKGHMAIGHNRYSTTGLTHYANIQPMLVDCKIGKIAVSHNGNLVNAVGLRKAMEEEGSIFRSTMDSEVVLHLIARSRKDTLEEMIAEALGRVKGAYSFVFMTKEQMIAARDPHGFRPLCLGKMGDAWVFSSESCAFDLIGATYIREVEPGEMCVVGANGMQSIRFAEAAKRLSKCIFEFIYFSRPDSKVFGENVDKVRRELGRKLADESTTEADIVIAVPDSSNTIALGFSEASNIPFELGLIRNHYVGRTFIQPKQRTRDWDVRIKFNPVKGVLKGKRPQTDPRHKFISEELLFPLRQRIQDLQQQLLVNQQGFLTTEMIIRNNKELIRGVNRANNVTVSALQVAVTLALALANQRLVLEKVQAIGETTENLIAGTASRLRTQGAEIQKQASGTQLDIGVLKQAFADIRAALEDVSRYRQEALPRMAENIVEMDRLAEESEQQIRKMEYAEQVASDFSIEIVD